VATLTLNAVRKTRALRQPVLQHIDLDVADGEFVVLVGPSGCGKSTLLRLTAGLDSVTSGEIRIGGRRVNDIDARDRDVAMVFQNYALYPHLTVADNIAFGMRMRGVAPDAIRTRVAQTARMLALDALLARKPGELSGGQRQRVAMGRAIVREPALFLFDEPLSNLDARLRAQLRVEMRRLHARLATTTLYVTHDQVEAMTLAQRIVVLNQGRVEQIDTPEQIYARPGSTFVASFMGAPPMNLLPGRLAADGGAFEVDGGPSLALPEAWRRVDGLRPGRGYVLGIRPEHLGLGRAEGCARAALPVELVEMLGADTLAFGAWGDASVAVRLPHGLRATPGDALELHLPPAHLHLFDRETGRRVH
jgi:sn-glycerol 3-phosphate transport system ATP-binding protein